MHDLKSTNYGDLYIGCGGDMSLILNLWLIVLGAFYCSRVGLRFSRRWLLGLRCGSAGLQLWGRGFGVHTDIGA